MQNYEKTFKIFGSFFYSMQGVEWLHTALKIVEKSTLNIFLYVAFSENADPDLAADLGTWLQNFKAKKSIFTKYRKKNFEKFEAILVRKQKFSLAVNLDLRGREKILKKKEKKESEKKSKNHINWVSNDYFLKFNNFFI